ncbi:efflux RND transporter periplasmic adaptor subunit [Fluviicola taffensis]|uniref:Efflux transporter, RND family, MFP subunit n=1 Tax=Fluviicola taffensis (strain DSM 16823 / NCIMB 13979 / RW262) TaxID=755732 RepID=F2IB49_FLUTR|nr:efflux RND transporter periplasmic adaptor subunit [Fluviicola taffensis]AEA42132.1 efflux transporter, RND family, MFP subunit [Fluviicola taffensis DSM 16823]
MKRVITIIIVAVVLVGLVVFKLMSNKKEVQAKIFINDVNAAVLVKTGAPVDHSFESSLSFLGSFDPARQNVVGSDANGKVVSIRFEEGDQVGQGKLLAKVDDEMLQLQLEGADVGLEGQKNDDRRYSNLERENAVSGVQVEKTKLGVRSSELQKKQIQKQIKSTSITAPYSGVITKKMVDLGSFVGQGTPLFELTDISSLKLTVNVPERDVLKFKLGQAVAIRADIYGVREFPGKISNISVVADKAHNFKVQITVPNPKRELMAGMYGSVRLKNNESVTRLSVPRLALVGSSKNPQVYVVRNKVAYLTTFTAGTSDGDYIEVVSGIKKGDVIVVKGQVNLQDKTNVKTN